jgi:hypothetical protein
LDKTNRAATHDQLGDALGALGYYAEAASAYAAATTANPTYPVAYEDLANT